MPVQMHQQKHQSTVWNLSKVNKKDTRMMSDDVSLLSLIVTLNRFYIFSIVSIAKFWQVIAEWEIYNVYYGKVRFKF